MLQIVGRSNIMLYPIKIILCNSSMFKKIAKYVVSASVIMQTAVASVMAQGQPPSNYIQGITNQAGGELIEFIRNTLNLAIGLAGLIAVGVLVYSGVQYILASGDEGKVGKATKGIQYSVIGLIICFIAVLIVEFVLKQVLKV